MWPTPNKTIHSVIYFLALISDVLKTTKTTNAVKLRLAETSVCKNFLTNYSGLVETPCNFRHQNRSPVRRVIAECEEHCLRSVTDDRSIRSNRAKNRRQSRLSVRLKEQLQWLPIVAVRQARVPCPSTTIDSCSQRSVVRSFAKRRDQVKRLE